MIGGTKQVVRDSQINSGTARIEMPQKCGQMMKTVGWCDPLAVPVQQGAHRELMAQAMNVWAENPRRYRKGELGQQIITERVADAVGADRCTAIPGKQVMGT